MLTKYIGLCRKTKRGRESSPEKGRKMGGRKEDRGEEREIEGKKGRQRGRKEDR